MTAIGAERLSVGHAFEERVASNLRARGFAVCAIGQGEWPADVREALRSGRALVRWTPDLLAVGMDGRAVLVDCKAPLKDDLQHRDFCVELAAVESHRLLNLWTDVAYVWAAAGGAGTLRVASCAMVVGSGRIVRDPGRRRGGSGTPLMVVPFDVTVDFDEAFGSPR